MVRAWDVTAMTLSPVSITSGLARLGHWGTIELTGARSAVLRLTRTADVELPEAVAVDLTGGVLLLNDEMGRLLFLPYAGELAVAYDLEEGKPLYSPVTLPRHADYGLRMAVIRVLPNDGAIHLTESTLACFREDCSVAWRQDDDFSGWAIEGVGLDVVHLVLGDWSGGEQRQKRSLFDGRRIAG